MIGSARGIAGCRRFRRRYRCFDLRRRDDGLLVLGLGFVGGFVAIWICVVAGVVVVGAFARLAAFAWLAVAILVGAITSVLATGGFAWLALAATVVAAIFAVFAAVALAGFAATAVPVTVVIAVAAIRRCCPCRLPPCPSRHRRGRRHLVATAAAGAIAPAVAAVLPLLSPPRWPPP
ncbi:MAG: hypothetical protein U1E49_05325 [Hyphomicrobiaceae bacterium]